MSINTITNKTVAGKVASAFAVGAMTVAVAFAFSVPQASAALTEAQIQSILSLLNSFGADSATVSNVNASLRGQATSGTGSSSTTGGNGFTFTQNLKQGDTGNEVMELQKFLNTDSATQVASTGAGSPGNESSYFGPATKAAVIKFQNKYAADVLAPVGLAAGTGFWGSSSRAKANTLNAGGSSNTGNTGTDTGSSTSTGTGLTVSNTSQPSNSLAPNKASRVPFTKFVVTASNDGDVVMNSVVVERTGLGSNSAFNGIILLDQDGIQLGNAKTLNSNNQATIGEKTTIKAGTSRTFTVAGNMPTSGTSFDGQQLTLSVKAVNTSATVNGSLPITGATHTVNATLSIGTITAARGSNDPNSARTPEVGTTGHIFSGVKVTAGSAEDVRVRSIRWNQSGSASASDLANLKVVAGGTEYAVTVGDDGDHYTAIFGNGIVVQKGLSLDMYIKGDIVNGSNRTVIFDIEKDTDIYVTGETFGYGITPTANSTGAEGDSSSNFSTDGDPFFDASTATIGTGSLVVSSTSDVPAGNIANGASNVALGSFKFDVKGEAVTWSSIVLTISTSSGTGTNAELTNLTLTDANGAVLAGPQDPASTYTTATLSDSVTLQPGANILVVRGNLNNNWNTDDTIQIKITPTNISQLKGDTSGVTITPTPGSAVNGNVQTVSAGTVTVSPNSSLVSQNVINNSSDVLLGSFTVDASQSGEDIKVTTVQVRGDVGSSADLDDLNTLQLFANGVALNTGSNAVNPSGNSAGTDANLTFTLDAGGYVVAKGTTQTIELRGSVAVSSPDANTTYKFDFSAGSPNWSVTGVTTGSDVSETLSTGAGATMTVSSAGTLTASVDSSDPVERWYVAGTEATVGTFKFSGTNEPMEVTDFALQIDGVSTTQADIQEVSIYNGATKLKTTTFTSNRALFKLDTPSFSAPTDGSAILTVKAKFAAVGSNKAGTSGHLVRVGTTTVASQNKARGTDSGTAVNILGSAGTTTGARYFKTLPTVAKGTVPSTVLANGTQELYRFTVTADNAGDVGLYKFSFSVSTSSANADSFKLTEVETGKIVRSGVVNSVSGVIEMTVNSSTYGATAITVPAGTTRTYKLEATVSNAGSSGDSVQTKLLGDGSLAVLRGNTTTIDTLIEDDFIWSPISTSTTLSTGNLDWFNGFRVPGLEFDDLGIITVSNI